MLVGEEKPKEETLWTMTVMFLSRYGNSTAAWNGELWKGTTMRGHDHHIGWDQGFYFMLSLDLGCRSISMRLGGLISPS